jgi:hypothetical protein
VSKFIGIRIEPRLRRSLHKIDSSLGHISSFNRASHFIAADRHAATVKGNVPSGLWKGLEGELIFLDNARDRNWLVLVRPHPTGNIVTGLFEGPHASDGAVRPGNRHPPISGNIGGRGCRGRLVARRAATQEKRHRGDAQAHHLSEVFPKRSNAETAQFYSHVIKNTAAAANVSEKLRHTRNFVAQLGRFNKLVKPKTDKRPSLWLGRPEGTVIGRCWFSNEFAVVAVAVVRVAGGLGAAAEDEMVGEGGTLGCM